MEISSKKRVPGRISKNRSVQSIPESLRNNLEKQRAQKMRRMKKIDKQCQMISFDVQWLNFNLLYSLYSELH